MRSLQDQLIAQITAQGPMSLADFMQVCLFHPAHGYYATRDPLGAAGDFTTAPEISQMFGELIGLALAQAWIDQGQPPGAVLAELGPGRGTLMRDAVRAVRPLMGDTPVHLVEASPTLRDVQATTLSGVDLHWHDHAATLPDAPLFLVANEFFDALPIRQFRRGEAGWFERQIGVKEDALVLGEAPETPLDALAHRWDDTAPGQVVELRASMVPIVQTLSDKIAQNGGAALIVDYGDWRSRGDTFQAVQAHKPIGALAAPGQADLTAHVDFEALAQAAQCAVTPMTTQGAFLERLGITARAQSLAKNLAGDALESHIAAHRRLTHPEAMGHLFKVIALHPEAAPPPPGFE